MRRHNWTALLLLPATAALAQTTGVAKPSAAVVATDTAVPAPATAAKVDLPTDEHRVVLVDGNKVTLLSPQVSVGGPTLDTATAAAPAVAADPDAGVVTEVPSGRNELATGTVLSARMDEEVSTNGSITGHAFSAHLTEDALKDGKVILPAGSIMQGRIVRLTAGKRINGNATIRLRPDTILLPDGALYMLHAIAIDSEPNGRNRVDSEGTIIDKGHAKREALIAGGVTAAAAATGAVFAGAPGAVIGAGVGAGIATTRWLMEERDAALPKDALVVFQLTEPMQLTPLRAENAPDKEAARHEKGGR